MKIPPRTVIAVLFLTMTECAAAAPLEGWYGGASLGMGTVKIERTDWDDGTLSGVTLDNRGVAYKIIAAYRFAPIFSLEGSYNHFGDVKFSGIEPGTVPSIWKTGPVSGRAAVKGVTVQAVGTWPFEERYGLFAKGGLFMWNTTLVSSPTLSGGTLALSDVSIQHDNGISWLYGAGAEVRFRGRWHVRWEWEHSTVRFAGTKERGVNISSLGVTFDF